MFAIKTLACCALIVGTSGLFAQGLGKVSVGGHTLRELAGTVQLK